MPDYLLVATTAGNPEDARKLADLLVARQLAACVQIHGPIRSVYRWQGAVEAEEEWLLTAKTRQDRYPALESALQEAHPYDVPEIIATPIVAGSAAYLRWVDGCLDEENAAE